MNAIEIEEAVSQLTEKPFEADEFPYAFLEAFGNKATTIKKLRSGASNKSDIGGVLQWKNIHIKVCRDGDTGATLDALRDSPATASQKARFILATDGAEFQAEDLVSGDTVVCEYTDLANHFTFFFELAGISTVKALKESSFDVKATGRLNKLYIELLKDNPDWATEERRHDLNHFLARLIFCFFAEDTGIFNGEDLFTGTVEQMSERDSSNTHEVISELFRAMNTPVKHEGVFDDRYRKAAKIRSWADGFPYVNGGLFSESLEVPKFSKIARAHLLHVGKLDWTKINPDIFGSMIQAVADDEERGALGMHYTSVPNILKVLNPLFLDDLRAKLEEAGDNGRKLLNLRNRMAKIRVFDPACGSGNFLVVAYKEMRAIEAIINERRNEADRKSELDLRNFCGIEIRDFSCEVARLALIIAEYQCDVVYRGPTLALAEFLPLQAANWITCGNALRLDWLGICPPTGTAVKYRSDDLFETPLDQSEIDFHVEAGETYICGNPPYLGSTWQSPEQKSELRELFGSRTKSWKSLDYVTGWFMKAANYGMHTDCVAAFVATNSICQGQQVPILWPCIFETGHEIVFAHSSFKWANLASHNAGVTVIIVGISTRPTSRKQLYSIAEDSDESVLKEAEFINAYLVAGKNVLVSKASKPLCQNHEMTFGNKAVDGGHLTLTKEDVDNLQLSLTDKALFIKRFYGSAEFIKSQERFVLWIHDKDLRSAISITSIKERIDAVRTMRLGSKDKGANAMAQRAHQMREMNIAKKHAIVVPRVSSEEREYLPVGLVDNQAVLGDRNFAIYDAPLWNMALVASRIHWVWIGAVCARLEMRFSYSNTLGWNTFPIPSLTHKNLQDLTKCAEEILCAREHYFPATIAEMYDRERMDADFPRLRTAHERNDEVLERIYIGRRFKNDTERLEKLFELYTKMTAKTESA